MVLVWIAPWKYPRCALEWYLRCWPRRITLLSVSDIRKLHVHLVRGSLPILLRAINASGRSSQRGECEEVIGCCSRRPQEPRIMKTLLRSYIPPYTGHTVDSDVFYPLGTSEVPSGKKKRSPFLSVACVLCRFVMARG